ncbi:ANL family adenylate-forming protein [Maricaulis maris]|uniref:Long-chain-fatty-acid--CoA ligase n=1 Tax=Maricaulis maris TaxID=74318 RepID=A0A495CXU3_9PROT|nr:fatty acid--CoA ligase family protein [Maricaulis maris]RKQ94112.1 acyl-CoA synthetase (AMP-forming)/AMP-acid ligase II [Maricaulis maris]
MTLKGCLAALDSERLLLRTPERSISVAELLSYPDVEALAGLRVALCFKSAEQAMQAIVALDGVAQQIVFLSAYSDDKDLGALITQSECDLVLTDLGVRLNAITDTPVADSLDQVAELDLDTRSNLCASRWVMTTSGTTGNPKLVGHTFESLTRSTKSDPERGATQRWGMLYEYSRFAGMQVVLQSMISGACLLLPASGSGLAEQIAFFADSGCTHVSATPTLWRKILMTPGHERLDLRQITLGGEIADDRILLSLCNTFPQARVTHIFASTEAGVGFAVSDRRGGFPASFLTDPPAGIGIRVVDGRLFIRNSQVAPRYIGTDTSFAEDGWVDTGDAVELREDRILFLGRASGVINVGGDKVHPEEIESLLLAHPNVSAARVYSKSNPIMGALVAADLVPVDLQDKTPSQLKAEIKSFIAERTERHKVPAFISLVEGFDANAAGKMLRVKQ